MFCYQPMYLKNLLVYNWIIIDQILVINLVSWTVLDLISDIDIHLFIEKEMRGGISYIGKKQCSRFVSMYNKCIINTWSVIIVVEKVDTLLILMQKLVCQGNESVFAIY